MLDNGRILGAQPNCLNCVYFCQDDARLKVSKLQGFDQPPRIVTPIKSGDVIDVRIDFRTNRAYFWLNKQQQGSVASLSRPLPENRLYPTVTLGRGTEGAVLFGG